MQNSMLNNTTDGMYFSMYYYFLGHNLNMYSFAPGHFRISRILLNKNARKVLRSTLFLSTFSAIPVMNTNYNYYIYETYGVPTNSEKFGQNRLKHIL